MLVIWRDTKFKFVLKLNVSKNIQSYLNLQFRCNDINLHTCAILFFM